MIKTAIYYRKCQVIKTIDLLKKKRPDLDIDIEVVDPYISFSMFKEYYSSENSAN